MSSTSAPITGTSASETVSFNNSKTGVTYDAGAGNDNITGSKGDDVIRGGTGADRIMGGAGNDTYVFVAGDLVGSLGSANGQNGSVDHIIDFQGAGSNSSSGFQDVIALYGYSDKATLTFDRYFSDRVQQSDGTYKLVPNTQKQYYKVADPIDSSRDGFILVQMQDGSGQLTASDYKFVRDTIGGTSTGAVTEAGGEANATPGTPTAEGKLTATTFNQATSFAQPDASALKGSYGSFTFASDGTWSYALDNAKAETQALKAGEIKTETLLVKTMDGTGATITVTVNGTNDKATFAGDDTGAVKEDTTLTSLGKLSATDADAGQSSFVAHEGASALKGAYGSLTIDSAGNWVYTLDNTSTTVQALKANETKIENFTVESFDGSANHRIVVTVTGVDEPPLELPNHIHVSGGGTYQATNQVDHFVFNYNDLGFPGSVTGYQNIAELKDFDQNFDKIEIINMPHERSEFTSRVNEDGFVAYYIDPTTSNNDVYVINHVDGDMVGIEKYGQGFSSMKFLLDSYGVNTSNFFSKNIIFSTSNGDLPV